jgi:3-methyladenine DNA glycosylase/8-oxoguanine DNA glycosylase
VNAPRRSARGECDIRNDILIEVEWRGARGEAARQEFPDFQQLSDHRTTAVRKSDDHGVSSRRQRRIQQIADYILKAALEFHLTPYFQ